MYDEAAMAAYEAKAAANAYALVIYRPDVRGMAMGPMLATEIATNGVSAFVVAWVIEFIVRDQGVGYGMCRGAMVGLAMAAAIGQCAYYDTRPRRLGLINGAYPLIGAVIVGAIASPPLPTA